MTINENIDAKSCLQNTSKNAVKLWYSHLVEYYSAMKKNELLTHITNCKELKRIMSEQKSQSQIIIYYMVPFIYYGNKIVEENKLLVDKCQRSGKKRGSY